MIIVTYVLRAKSPDDARTVCAMSSHEYSLRMRTGLIRTDCAIKVGDPCVILGIVYWGSEAARDIGERVEEARTVVAKNEPYLAAPAEISVYEVC